MNGECNECGVNALDECCGQAGAVDEYRGQVRWTNRMDAALCGSSESTEKLPSDN